MSTKFLSPGWRMPRNANQSKQSNYSMYIDVGGSSSNIDTNYYLPSGTNPKSISFWLKNVDPNGWITTGYQYTVHGGALSTGQGFGVGIIGSSSGAYIWFIGHSTADYFIPSSATGTMTTNVWYHIVVTYDNTRTNNLHFYLDGVKIDEANESLNTSSANSVKIGANATGGGGSGSQYVYVNQVCFFDYALSSSQVTTLWGGGTSVSNPMALPSPPKAYYPLGTPAWNGQYLAENNAIGDYVFDFDGVDDYIDCSSISSIPSATELTVSFWANTNSTSQNQVVFGDNSSSPIFSFEYWGSSNKMFFEYGTGTYAYLTLTSVVTAGNWHNVVLVYNASGASNTDKIKIYVDGVDKSSLLTYVGTIPTSLNASIGNFWIGNGQNYNQSFNGKISNAQIFNTALPATDVETLYNYGSPIRTLANIPQSSNLKAWYKLDASEIYNSSTTDWSVDNNKYPSTYNSSINLVRASSQKIDIANGSELDFTEDFTMSIWVNLTTSNNNMGIFNKTSQANSNGVTLFKRGGANFEFYVSEYSNVLTFASQGDNIWQQITITLNRTTGERVAYINGEQAATLTHIKTFAFPNQGWDIGTFATNSLNYLDAKVSNFKLFNTVLSPTEVQTLYNNGTPLTDMSSFTSLKGWWKLNNLSSGLTDSSSNSNNATITSGTNEYAGFVNALAGDSTGMTQANLVQSDLQTVAPYSKYAMNFDAGSSDYIDLGSDSSLNIAGNDFSCSLWFNTTTTAGNKPLFALEAFSNKFAMTIEGASSFKNVGFSFNWNTAGSSTYYYNGGNNLTDGNWHNYIITKQGTTVQAYIDGSAITFGNLNGSASSSNANRIARWYHGYYDGKISNISLWDKQLSSSEVREIYNEGLPSDLNSHSAYSNLVSWWQLGENSSFATNWICADEKGTNNGTSANMGVDALTNGVGTTANGISTGMSEGSLIGNAPYSTANAVSSGMAVTAKGTDVP